MMRLDVFLTGMTFFLATISNSAGLNVFYITSSGDVVMKNYVDPSLVDAPKMNQNYLSSLNINITRDGAFVLKNEVGPYQNKFSLNTNGFVEKVGDWNLTQEDVIRITHRDNDDLNIDVICNGDVAVHNGLQPFINKISESLTAAARTMAMNGTQFPSQMEGVQTAAPSVSIVLNPDVSVEQNEEMKPNEFFECLNARIEMVDSEATKQIVTITTNSYNGTSNFKLSIRSDGNVELRNERGSYVESILVSANGIYQKTGCINKSLVDTVKIIREKSICLDVNIATKTGTLYSDEEFVGDDDVSSDVHVKNDNDFNKDREVGSGGIDDTHLWENEQNNEHYVDTEQRVVKDHHVDNNDHVNNERQVDSEHQINNTHQVANESQVNESQVDKEHQLEAREHQVDGSEHQMEASEHQMEDKEYQVEDKQHQVEASEHQVEASEHQVEASENPVEASENPVEASENPVEASKQQVEDKKHQVEASEHQVETSEYQVETSEYQEETSEHKEDVSEHKEETSEHKEETSEHKEETSEHQAETSEHQAEASEHQVEASEHQVEASEHQVEASEHQVEADEHQVEADEHQVEADEHQVEADEHQVEADEHQVEADEHQVEADEHQVEADEHQVEADEHQVEADEHQVEANEHQVEDSEHQVEDNKHQVEAKEHQVEANEHQVEANEHQVEASEHQVEANEHQVEANEHQVGDSEHQVEDNKHQVEANEHQVEANEHQVEANEHQVEESKHRIEDNKNQVEANNDQVGDNKHRTDNEYEVEDKSKTTDGKIGNVSNFEKRNKENLDIIPQSKGNNDAEKKNKDANTYTEIGKFDARQNKEDGANNNFGDGNVENRENVNVFENQEKEKNCGDCNVEINQGDRNKGPVNDSEGNRNVDDIEKNRDVDDKEKNKNVEDIEGNKNTNGSVEKEKQPEDGGCADVEKKDNDGNVDKVDDEKNNNEDKGNVDENDGCAEIENGDDEKKDDESNEDPNVDCSANIDKRLRPVCKNITDTIAHMVKTINLLADIRPHVDFSGFITANAEVPMKDVSSYPKSCDCSGVIGIERNKESDPRGCLENVIGAVKTRIVNLMEMVNLASTNNMRLTYDAVSSKDVVIDIRTNYYRSSDVKSKVPRNAICNSMSKTIIDVMNIFNVIRANNVKLSVIQFSCDCVPRNKEDDVANEDDDSKEKEDAPDVRKKSGSEPKNQDADNDNFDLSSVLSDTLYSIIGTANLISENQISLRAASLTEKQVMINIVVDPFKDIPNEERQDDTVIGATLTVIYASIKDMILNTVRQKL